jgi:hypothetical protein
MNGVLHSEHVISRSGIAVFSKRGKIEDSLSMLFGALALRFFHHSLWNESTRIQTLRRKAWRPDG